MANGMGAIFYKESRHLLRDPATFVLALAIPMLQLVIFGYAIDTDVRDIKTVVVDLSRTAASRDFIRSLENTDYFRVVEYQESVAEVESAIRSGRAKVGVIVDRRFAEAELLAEAPRVQVLVDGSDPTVSARAQTTAMLLAHAGGAPPPTDVRPRVLFNESGESARFYVPGLAAVILQLVLMMLTAFAIVRERESGTLEQLLVTPVSRAGLMAGKLLPFVGLGSVTALVVYGAMVLIFGVPVAGDALLLAGLTLLFVFTALSLGLVISTLVKTQLHAMLLSFAILMPSILLSGFAFPRESMPPPIYAVTFALPTTYFVDILRGIVLRGASVRELSANVLPLAAIGIALFAVGTARFRKRLD